MAADLEIGADINLTTTLATNDRITITRAANGQKVATMTVAEFMNKCASMMPIISDQNNGILSPTIFSNILKHTQKGSINDRYDLNNEKRISLVGGYYFVNAPIDHSYLIVLTLPLSGDWIAQLAWRISSSGLGHYTRSFYSGTTWSEWKFVH